MASIPGSSPLGLSKPFASGIVAGTLAGTCHMCTWVRRGARWELKHVHGSCPDHGAGPVFAEDMIRLR